MVVAVIVVCVYVCSQEVISVSQDIMGRQVATLCVDCLLACVMHCLQSPFCVVVGVGCAVVWRPAFPYTSQSR